MKLKLRETIYYISKNSLKLRLIQSNQPNSPPPPIPPAVWVCLVCDMTAINNNNKTEQEILAQITKKCLVVQTVLNSAACPSHWRILIELSLKYRGLPFLFSLMWSIYANKMLHKIMGVKQVTQKLHLTLRRNYNISFSETGSNFHYQNYDWLKVLHYVNNNLWFTMCKDLVWGRCNVEMWQVH